MATCATMARSLLFHGALLFLLGLLNGILVQVFHNPRMGLSAHLAGVQNALVLWAFGLIWPYATLAKRTQTIAAWSAIYGMYAIWLGLVLAAVFGASRSLPIAGNGYSASAIGEATVDLLVYSGSVAIISATLSLLQGLRKGPGDGNAS